MLRSKRSLGIFVSILSVILINFVLFSNSFADDCVIEDLTARTCPGASIWPWEQYCYKGTTCHLGTFNGVSMSIVAPEDAYYATYIDYNWHEGCGIGYGYPNGNGCYCVTYKCDPTSITGAYYPGNVPAYAPWIYFDELPYSYSDSTITGTGYGSVAVYFYIPSANKAQPYGDLGAGSNCDQ